MSSSSRSVNQAKDAAERIAAGDLTVDVRSDGKDETAQLLQALQGMKDNLADIVGGVRQNAEGVATASARIAQGNQDLSQRTEEQAAALEETAASMEQLNATVKQNAENAKQANRLALGASTVAIKGGEVVSQVVTTMKGTNDSSKKIADTRPTLGAKAANAKAPTPSDEAAPRKTGTDDDWTSFCGNAFMKNKARAASS